MLRKLKKLLLELRVAQRAELKVKLELRARKEAG